MPRGRLTVPERHQLRIAKKTLKMSDAGARIMGGMTKEEARKVIYRLTGRRPRESVQASKRFKREARREILRLREQRATEEEGGTTSVISIMNHKRIAVLPAMSSMDSRAILNQLKRLNMGKAPLMFRSGGGSPPTMQHKDPTSTTNRLFYLWKKQGQGF